LHLILITLTSFTADSLKADLLELESAAQVPPQRPTLLRVLNEHLGTRCLA
jgi:hypothetical protein